MPWFGAVRFDLTYLIRRIAKNWGRKCAIKRWLQTLGLIHTMRGKRVWAWRWAHSSVIIIASLITVWDYLTKAIGIYKFETAKLHFLGL